jgi:hypothetical protein
MRKKPAMFPVTNDGVDWAVYGAVGGAIFGAVNWAVDLTGAERRTAVESVGWAVEEAVNWAVGLAVKEVLRETIASREEPTHPGLGLYLEAVA